MKIYYITFSYWNGRSYTFDYNKFFSSKQERDAAYEELRHNAGFDLCKGEDDIILPEVFDTAAFQKGVEEGRRLERDEPVSDCHDLEEAAEKYAIEYAEREKPKDADGEIWRVGDVMIENRMSFEDGFKAGAEWQKAKMMEGAVVARVSIDELSCGLYNLCVEAGITSETDTTIIILPKED